MFGMTVSVIIPALNEAKNLPYVLPRLPEGLDEVILVDGHSTDGTIEVARQLYPGIRVISQRGRGKGAALRSGYAAATGDVVVMIDADGSNDPGEIPAFVQALSTGAHFAKGSRFMSGGGTADMPLYRALGNWAFVLLVRVLFGARFTDLCYGYNAFRREILPSLHLDCDGFEVETILNMRVVRNGWKYVEVPSFEDRRIHGESNLHTFSDGWRVLRSIIGEAFIPTERQPVAAREPVSAPAQAAIARS